MWQVRKLRPTEDSDTFKAIPWLMAQWEVWIQVSQPLELLFLEAVCSKLIANKIIYKNQRNF